MDENKLNISPAWIEKFKRQTEKLDNGCVAWRGGHSLRLPESIEKPRFTTPRRAAYLVKHRQLPETELQLACHTENCVNPRHFIETRVSHSGRQNRFTENDYALIKKDYKKEKSYKKTCEKWSISKGMLHRILKQK